MDPRRPGLKYYAADCFAPKSLTPIITIPVFVFLTVLRIRLQHLFNHCELGPIVIHLNKYSDICFVTLS